MVSYPSGVITDFPTVFAEAWCGEHSPVIIQERAKDCLDRLASSRIASALKYLDTCEELWGLEGDGEVPRWRRVFLAELRRRLTP